MSQSRFSSVACMNQVFRQHHDQWAMGNQGSFRPGVGVLCATKRHVPRLPSVTSLRSLSPNMRRDASSAVRLSLSQLGHLICCPGLWESRPSVVPPSSSRPATKQTVDMRLRPQVGRAVMVHAVRQKQRWSGWAQVQPRRLDRWIDCSEVHQPRTCNFEFCP